MKVSPGCSLFLNRTIQNNAAKLLLVLTCLFIQTAIVKAQEFDLDSLVRQVQLEKIVDNGPKDNRANIAFINRGGGPNAYRAGMKAEFLEDIRYITRALVPGDSLSFPPYTEYRDFFNFYALWLPDAPSLEEGWNYVESEAVLADIFLPWAGETGWATIMSLPNGVGGGGGAGANRAGRYGDVMLFGNELPTVIHEYGHTMPFQHDEYSAGSGPRPSWCPNGPNATPYTSRAQIPWRAWIDEDIPIPTPDVQKYRNKVGVFEGGVGQYFGCYRPTSDACLMGLWGEVGNLLPQLCPVCKQAVVHSIYRNINVIENPQPPQSEIEVQGGRDFKFSVDVIKPIPNTQRYEWFLNGNPIARGVTEIDLRFFACEEYEVRFVVTDTTEFVRHDPPFSSFPQQAHVWNLEQIDVAYYPAELLVTSRPVSCHGDGDANTASGDGQIRADFEGAASPISYVLRLANADEILAVNTDGVFSNLNSGAYRVSAVDKNGCGRVQSIEVQAAPRLEVELRSEWINNSWSVRTITRGYRPQDLSFAWSNGASSPNIHELPNGTYRLSVTTVDDCEVTAEIDLRNSDEALSAAANVVPASNGLANGYAWIDISGGRPPYTLRWVEDDPDGGPLAQKTVSDAQLRKDLAPGTYLVIVKDANCSVRELVIDIAEVDSFEMLIEIEKDGPNMVRVSNPQPNTNYLWFDAPAAEKYIHVGPRFQPLAPGNYYVAAQRVISDAISDNRRGFAITMDAVPRPFVQRDSSLAVLDPDGSTKYFWYAEAFGGTVLHEGTTFTPAQSGRYYVAARKQIDYPTPLLPDEASAAPVLWFDASDLNADGRIDVPAPVKAANHDWIGKTGNYKWNHPPYWFAYIPNRENGLGVAQFERMWVQSLNQIMPSYQSVILVYRESEMSRTGSAPFQHLNAIFPRHSDSTQLLWSEAGLRSLESDFYLNGDLINPLSTPNPMQFCVVGIGLHEAMPRGSAWTNAMWNGDLAEIILWDVVLSPEEQAGIAEHLRSKWLSFAHLESARVPVSYNATTVSVDEDITGGQLLEIGNVNEFGVQFNSPAAGRYFVEVFNIQGKLIFSAQGAADLSGSTWHAWPAEGLGRGSLIVSIRQGTAQVATMLLIGP